MSQNQSTLTEEQRRRIEENRRMALAKRAAAAQNVSSSSPKMSILTPSNLPSGSAPSPTSFYSRKIGNSQKKNKSPVVYSAPKESDCNKTSSSKWTVVTDVLTASCSLISRNRFVVNVGYNAKLIDIFKTIPGKEYNPTKRTWNFPLDQYEHLKKLTEPLSPGIIIGRIPQPVLRLFTENKKITDLEQIDLSPIDQTLVDSLFPFQKLGVKFSISKQGKCLIADEMGLGKTIQAIAISDYYRSDFPLLIICPSSMRYQWEAELTRYLRGVSSNSIIVVTSGKTYIENCRVVIISYDLVSKLKSVLQNFKFGIMICDESHKMKSIQTQRTKTILALAKTMKRVILLTGTPALSRPVELFPQMKAIQPGLFSDMTTFGIRYCDGKQDRFGWNFQGSSNLEELKVVLEENMMIRRLKVDVLDQLPEKIRQVVHLSNDLVDKSSKNMKKFEKRLNDEDLRGANKRSTLLSYFAESGKAKIKAILAYIEELLERDTKFLCFAHHRDVLDAISNLLETKQIFYIRIDGSVSSEDRKSVCDQFQAEEKFRVAVLSITAASTGITLTAAQLVVFCELYWNPGELIQAEDRAHRIGQKSSVLVQYLVARGTADDTIWPMIQSKLNVLNKAGLSNESNLNVTSANGLNPQNMMQSTILSFLDQIDDGFDDEELEKVMDEIEFDIPAKKIRKS